MPAPRSPSHSTAFIHSLRQKRGSNITDLNGGAAERIPAGAARRGANNTVAMAQRSNAKAASPTVEFPPRLSSGYYLVRDARRTFQRLLERRIAPYGVLSPRELSARVGMMEPTNVIALPSMEKAGLVVRMREEGDRRKMRVLLIAKAERVRNELLGGAPSTPTRRKRASTRDLSCFRRVIARMTANFDRIER
jgi:DNA-binding MarR family transcriptional regulator